MRENIHPLYASDSQKKIDVPIPEAAQEVKEDTTPSLTEAFHVATEEIVERLPKLHDKRLAELVKLGFGLPIVSCIERRLEENLKSAFRTYPETLGLLLQEKYAARMLDAIGRIPPSAWPDSLCAALEFTSYEYKPQVLSLLETHLDQIDFSRPAVASMIGAMMVDTRMVEMVLRMIAQHFQTIDLRNEKISWLLLLAVDQRQIDQVISLLPLQIQMNHVGEWGQELLGRLVGYGQADALFKRIPSGQIDITDKRIHILFLLAASHCRAEWVL